MPRKDYTDAQRATDYKDVFDSVVGRRVLHDILSKAAVYSPNMSYGEEGQRVEGMRALALHIASFVVFDARSFLSTYNQVKEEQDDV